MAIINMIGIDPGNNTGVAIYKVEVPGFKIKSIETDFKILDHYVDEVDNDTRLMLKVLHLQKYIKKLCNEYNPKAVAMETAFLNTRFPKAVMQLSKYTLGIELGILQSNPFIKIFRYPPKYIKRFVGAGGNAKKDDMLKNLKKIKEITKHIKVDDLTEHEIDAISIAYVMLQEVRKNELLLYKV